MACIVSAIVCCLGDKTWLYSETFVTKFLAVTAPSPYCYCSVAVNKCAVTAASRGSTIADLALTTTCQPELCIPWRRFTHILPCHTLIPIVLALVCATAPPVHSPAKPSAILDESVTAVTASRFSPVIIFDRSKLSFQLENLSEAWYHESEKIPK